MIRTEAEYQEAVIRIEAEKQRMSGRHDLLQEKGLTPEEIKRVLDPILSFHEQLKEEVAYYERIKRGDFDALDNLRGLGQQLIGARIYLGISQRQLAERLSVHESQVSRDERNEYRGLTIERASSILEALKLHARTVITPPSRSPERDALTT